MDSYQPLKCFNSQWRMCGRWWEEVCACVYVCVVLCCVVMHNSAHVTVHGWCTLSNMGQNVWNAGCQRFCRLYYGCACADEVVFPLLVVRTKRGHKVTRVGVPASHKGCSRLLCSVGYNIQRLLCWHLSHPRSGELWGRLECEKKFQSHQCVLNLKKK